MALRHRLAGRAMRLYWGVLRPRTFGVRALVIDRDDRVARVRHTYIDGWYLPGGGVEKRESAEAAIRRELIEEVALGEVTIERILGVYHNAAEAKDDHVIVYVVRAADHDTLRAADTSENAEVAWFALGDLPQSVSPATARRLADYRAGRTGHGTW